MQLKNNGTNRFLGSLDRSRRVALPMVVCTAALTGAASGWLMNDPAVPQPPVQTAPAPTTQIEPDWDVWSFNGRPVRAARTVKMLVTAYSPDARSCGAFADGITASGYSVKTNGMRLVAADTTLLPFGSMLSIPGYDDGYIVPVLDRGGAITGDHLDVLFPTHDQALQWGVQHLDVTIWEYADGKPNDFKSIY